MKGLLVLGLGLVALAAASRLTLQERVVGLVLEAFHNRSVGQWMYKEQAGEKVTERRRQVCLACVKFDSRSPSKVLDSHMHCRTETQHAVKEMETKRHEEKCRTVQETGEAPYHPGRFAFSRGLPS
ncbi:Retinoic acid receptor responder protein 2 [Chelonia mydas]|uniref:Retinoic acid receptor responder protein 2 n=1 Tax=Chelonia mydas TaxID=8469 RepID=M7AQ04_CHEMY|nr:Retinoic acid receptor responder protein 2 [Chelonia mydas]